MADDHFIGKPPFIGTDKQYVKGHSEIYGQPTGAGFRPSFHALWHLSALRVVDDLSTFSSQVWKTAAKAAEDDPPIRIAIVDTAVDYRHACLRSAVDKGLMRDFSQSALGAFAVLDPSELSKDERASRGSLLSASEEVAPWIREAIETEVDWIEKNKNNSMLLQKRKLGVFGAHGTAVAGLIGARPTTVQLRSPAFAYGISGESIAVLESYSECRPLPYSGINPFCSLVPICVAVTPSPEMLLGAIQYALLLQPDIVVIADSWDRAKSNDCSAEADTWSEVEKAFLLLCQKSIVLCAAGNEDLETPVYPASLSSSTSGPWAVGACNHLGDDLSYTPSQADAVKDGFWMLKTLSTELPRFDRDKTCIDPFEAIDKDLGSPIADANYPLWDIVSTDLPGRAGYNPSPFVHDPTGSGEHFEIGSLFCRFAGTSASTAIAAGLISLIPRDKLKVNMRPSDSSFNAKDKLVRLFDAKAAKEIFS